MIYECAAVRDDHARRRPPAKQKQTPAPKTRKRSRISGFHIHTGKSSYPNFFTTTYTNMKHYRAGLYAKLQDKCPDVHKTETLSVATHGYDDFFLQHPPCTPIDTYIKIVRFFASVAASSPTSFEGGSSRSDHISGRVSTPVISPIGKQPYDSALFRHRSRYVP